MQCVWDVVGPAPVFAMAKGRRFMAPALNGIPAFTPGPAVIERAITLMVVTVWDRQREFAIFGLPRKVWALVHPRHLLLRVVSGVPECSLPEGLCEVDCLSADFSVNPQVFH